MENTKKYGNAQSIVKGLLISSVVMFHCITTVNSTSYTNFNILYVLFPCLLGVFFFYAGYNYNPNKRSVKENIKRRTKQLLIPLLIMYGLVTIFIVPLVLIKHIGTFNDVLYSYAYEIMSPGLAILVGFSEAKCIIEILLGLGVGWFLLVLWICTMIFLPIINFIIKKLYRLIIAVIILILLSFILGHFVGTYLPYSANCFPVVIAVLITAAYLRQYNVLDLPLDNKKRIVINVSTVIIAEIIICGIGLLCYYGFDATLIAALPGGAFNGVIKGFDAICFYVISILGTYVIHSIGRYIDKIPFISNALEFFGKQSTIIYLTHALFICYIDNLIFQKRRDLGSFQPYLYFIIIIIIYIIFFTVIYLIKKNIQKKKEGKENGNSN